MPDELENDNEVSDDELDDEFEDDDDEVDNEEEPDDDEVEDPDGTVGGSGADGADSDGNKASEATVVAPKGKALLDALKEDDEARRELASTLENLMRENARTAAQQAEQAEFAELVKNKDYAAIGEKLVERQALEQARQTVADEVLREQFGPVYREIFAQPEFQTLTAEEKESLQPTKFASDAAYIRHLESFVQTKRYNAAVEAEVERRIQARDEAARNNASGLKARQPSLGATPAATGERRGPQTASALLAEGFRSKFLVDAAEDDD